jgi:Ca-activated chloride channel family protein
VETDYGLVPAGGRSQKVVLKVTLIGRKLPETRERPPVNLSIVLDRSGSMRGEKVEKAREGAIEALRRLNSRDTFSVVVYNHTVETPVPAQRVSDERGIEAQIKRIEAGGRTALFGGVSRGAAEIRKNIEEKYVHRIILLSDGLANVGPSSPRELGRLGASLLKQGISVTTVGVGTDYNEDLMTRLSQKSDGNAYFVQSSKDLPRIFAAELGDVLSVTAKNVQLVLHCPDGVKPVRIIGREGRIKDQTVELAMNQLYGGQEKYALIEVEVKNAVNGKNQEIASARVRYLNPLTGETEASTGTTSVRFSDNREDVEKSVNASVKKAYELTLNAMAQDRAIALADEGKVRDAVKLLNRSATRLREAGKRYGAAPLLQRATDVSSQAGHIEKRGMTPTYRKYLRTDSYQMKIQQRNR